MVSVAHEWIGGLVILAGGSELAGGKSNQGANQNILNMVIVPEDAGRADKRGGAVPDRSLMRVVIRLSRGNFKAQRRVKTRETIERVGVRSLFPGQVFQKLGGAAGDEEAIERPSGVQRTRAPILKQRGT